MTGNLDKKFWTDGIISERGYRSIHLFRSCLPAYSVRFSSLSSQWRSTGRQQLAGRKEEGGRKERKGLEKTIGPPARLPASFVPAVVVEKWHLGLKRIGRATDRTGTTLIAHCLCLSGHHFSKWVNCFRSPCFGNKYDERERERVLLQNYT